jgi:hypothetical protein
MMSFSKNTFLFYRPRLKFAVVLQAVIEGVSMKNMFKRASFLGVALLMSELAKAVPAGGGMSDGGGNAVVCRRDGQITSAQLLDLYEAEMIEGLKSQRIDPTLGYRDIALAAAGRIDAGGAGENQTSLSTTSVDGKVVSRSVGIFPLVPSHKPIQGWVDFISKNMRLLPDGVNLKPLDDSKNIIMPRDCAIEQTALYNDANEQILVVGEIWNQMDSANKAALLVHEALYKNLRMIWSEATSERTRVAVGRIFAGQVLKSVLAAVPNDVQVCFTDEDTPQNRFAVYDTRQGAKVYQFLMMDGKAPLTRTAATLMVSPLGDRQSISLTVPVHSLLEKNLNVTIRFQKSAGGDTELYLGTNKVLCTQRHFRVNDDNSVESW